MVGNSDASHSSLITMQTAGVPVFMDFSGFNSGVVLRMCVLHDQNTNSYSDYVHVRLSTGTDAPTLSPSTTPTGTPTSRSPTQGPSSAPSTQGPSSAPVTMTPSVSTQAPGTGAPVNAPTNGPTLNPSRVPTTAPVSTSPSTTPTGVPTTISPSASPATTGPTRTPTSTPVTNGPVTAAPSKQPTAAPITTSPTRTPITVAPTLNGETYAPTTNAPTPAPRFSGLTCTGHWMRLLCPLDQVVNIETANWGRTDKYGGEAQYGDDNCGRDRDNTCVQDVSIQLQTWCGSSSVCEVNNPNLDLFFGGIAGASPCPDTYKYFNYTYTCAAQPSA